MEAVKNVTPGTFSAYRVQHNGAVAIKLMVRGNVGAGGRDVLNKLGFIPVVDIANCRELLTTTPAELDAARNALIAAGVIVRPAA